MDKTTREQNRKDMFTLMEQYLLGGQTQEKFCAEHAINPARFYYWLKRYRESRQGEQGFVPVKILSGKQLHAVPTFEIQYPNGVILRLPGTTSPDYLRLLIARM